MAKDPAFLFYPGDWLGGTLNFTRAQKGAYMDLLIGQFNIGRMSLEDIETILGEDFSTMWLTKLRTKFVEDENGCFYNEKLENEINKRNKFKPYKTAAAILGGLISSRKLTKKQVTQLKKDFNINDFIEYDSKKMKVELSKWLTEWLTIFENENENILNNSLKESEKTFLSEVLKFEGQYPREMLNKFFLYWSEPNIEGTKMRFELEKVFGLARRLKYWASREKNKNEDPGRLTYDQISKLAQEKGPQIWDKYEMRKIGGLKFWILKKPPDPG